MDLMHVAYPTKPIEATYTLIGGTKRLASSFVPISCMLFTQSVAVISLRPRDRPLHINYVVVVCANGAYAALTMMRLASSTWTYFCQSVVATRWFVLHASQTPVQDACVKIIHLKLRRQPFHAKLLSSN